MGDNKEKAPEPEDSGSVAGSTRTTRQRTLTEKGYEYQVNLCIDNYTAARNAWSKLYNSIDNKLKDISEVVVLEIIIESVTTKYDKFLDSFKKLEPMEFDGKSHICNEFQTYAEKQLDIKEKMEGKLLQLQQQLQQNDVKDKPKEREKQDEAIALPKFDDNESISSRHSQASTASANSKGSLKSFLKKLDTDTKAAKIREELMHFEKDKEELEQRKLMKMQELKIVESEQREIAKEAHAYDFKSTRGIGTVEMEARYKVEQYLKSQPNFAHMNPVGMTERTTREYPPLYANSRFQLNEEDRAPVGAYSLNPMANDFMPAFYPTHDNIPHASPYNVHTQQHAATNNVVEKLVELLTERSGRDSLPRPEPEVFSGDLFKYPMWITSFESVIESKTSKPEERLYYLGRYTKGEAHDAISGLLCLNSKQAYEKARLILKERYGNAFTISDAYRKRIMQWPKIPPNDGMALRKFSDFLENCKAAMKSIEYLKALDDPKENQMMLQRLPANLVSKWKIIVDKCLHNDEESDDDEDIIGLYSSTGRYPSFSEFCKFIRKEARIACNPVTNVHTDKDKYQKFDSSKGMKTGQRKEAHKVKSFVTGSKEATAEGSVDQTPDKVNGPKAGNPKGNVSCYLCKEPHELINCNKFLNMSVTNRQNVVTKHRLCRGCLKWGHIKKYCRNKMTCLQCKGKHPTVIHDSAYQKLVMSQKVPVPDVKKETVVVSNKVEMDTSQIDFTISNKHTLIVPVWLHQKDNDNAKILVYALLDEQSDACFIKESTAKKLSVNGPEVLLKVSTLSGDEQVASNKIKDLVICGFNESESINLPPTYIKENIPARRGHIPRRETAQRWPHLKEIADKMMPYEKDVEVGLLIGISCTRALQPREVVVGKEDDPYAKKTLLGWGIIGQIDYFKCKEDESEALTVHRVVTEERVVDQDHMKCMFALQSKVREVLDPIQVSKMFELDFNERGTDENTLSYEDKRFLSKVKGGIHQLPSGQYEAPLPLKDGIVKLPNNKELALKRLMNLKKKLKNNSKFSDDYTEFMTNMIDKGYAEMVPSMVEADEVWYIPHHGVYHPRKPDKIRIVFDCSAVFKNQSLNQHLYQGPDLTNNLVGVLCRFRKESIAFMCDIEAMFHQIKVNPENRDLMRFLWWRDNNIDNEVVEYRMTVHPFGATSSPSVANLVLKTTADEYEEMYGKEAANFVRNEFYVDDGLMSVPSVTKALEVIDKSKELCKKGGFNLHKFVSNSNEVLSRIDPQNRATSVKDLDMAKLNIPVERTLGVQWCIESDCFQFKVHLKDKPLTRRGMLSTVSSIFDPLGIVSPFILTGKRILQDLCCDGADWDDDIPDVIKPRWNKWKSELFSLQNVKVPRCYKPDEFDEIKTAELHSFSDASQVGYGQCSYLRLIDRQNRIHCCLVMAKSRVTPVKPITIPRLELTAAVVAVKVSAMLKKELDYEHLQEVFWTDSKVVLGYINNETKRFHTFVANRVQQIKDHTSASQWKYIDSNINPADHASRGLNVQDLIDCECWWNGPSFLWKPTEDDTPKLDWEDILENDPEVRVKSVYATHIEENAPILKRLEVFSDWHKAKRAVAVCLRFQKRFKLQHQSAETTKANCKYNPVNVEEIIAGEREIIKQVQHRSFANEIKILKGLQTEEGNTERNEARKCKQMMKGTSSLYKLDPFIDGNGILRVGGRIRRADIPITEKHPAILPSSGHITELIVCDCHQRVRHQGRGITINEIRSSGYWILGGSSVVAKHITKCITCKRLRKPCQDQKMSDLPVDRLEPAPPFTYCAVDYFGPWYVKAGRRELKRYGVLFTCLVSRAVHIEVAHSLDTDSFLNAYRRFVSRRGPVRHLRSDQGTNFVGAKNELDMCVQQLNHDKLRAEMLKDNCDWIDFKMNVPQASHMGGVWERQIRSVRSVMTALLYQHGHQLDDESLLTFMTEAEAIINSRPLTVNTQSDPDVVEPLTPNHLLTMKSKIVLPPPGIFQKTDMYCRKRWRRVQYLANEFWHRWKREYVQSLQVRNKWIKPKRDIQIDDIVIVKDDNVPRNNWKLARVVEAYKEEDGHVRKVKLMMADPYLDDKGRRTKTPTYLERPIHSLVYMM